MAERGGSAWGVSIPQNDPAHTMRHPHHRGWGGGVVPFPLEGELTMFMYCTHSVRALTVFDAYDIFRTDLHENLDKFTTISLRFCTKNSRAFVQKYFECRVLGQHPVQFSKTERPLSIFRGQMGLRTLCKSFFGRLRRSLVQATHSSVSGYGEKDCGTCLNPADRSRGYIPPQVAQVFPAPVLVGECTR